MTPSLPVVDDGRQGEGASVPDQALAVSVEPVARLDPPGFDPSREEIGCPYELTDDRMTVWLDGYQAALSWMRETTQ